MSRWRKLNCNQFPFVDNKGHETNLSLWIINVFFRHILNVVNKSQWLLIQWPLKTVGTDNFSSSSWKIDWITLYLTFVLAQLTFDCKELTQNSNINKLKCVFTSNNSIRRSPRGAINFVISCIAFISRSRFSSFDTPQYGVMSPTIDSAKSCTNANERKKKMKQKHD